MFTTEMYWNQVWNSRNLHTTNKVHDRLNQTNPTVAMEFKNTMGMLKIPDCLKCIVRCNRHYHMVVMSNTSIYSRNAYKKATGETYPRRVASCKRNVKAAGKLDNGHVPASLIPPVGNKTNHRHCRRPSWSLQDASTWHHASQTARGGC